MVTMGRYAHGCRYPGSAKSSVKTHYVEWMPGTYASSYCRNFQEVNGSASTLHERFATEAPILLLDEPTSYLDLRHQLEIWHLLQDLVKGGKLVIVAVHDLLAAERFCDQLVILNRGRCQATGSYADIMTPYLLQEVFGVIHDATTGVFKLDNGFVA